MGFNHALSGLNAASKSLDIIGHNIANSATVGFKSSRTEFSEAVASAVGSASASSSGIGVTTAAITQKFTQGSINPTGRNLDVALNGSGFFIVKQADGSEAYTRSGNFQLDDEGVLRTVQGDTVLGRTIDPATGNPVGNEMNQMQFKLGTPLQGKVTESVSLALNLDARAYNAAGDVSATPPIQPTARATYGTSLNVYDVQGVTSPLNFYFEKASANTWNVFNGLDSSTSSPPVIAPATGQLIADATGNIVGMVQPTDYPEIPDGEGPFSQEAHYPTTFTYSFYGAGAPDDTYAMRAVTLTAADVNDMWDFSKDADGNITSARLRSFPLASLDDTATTVDLTLADNSAVSLALSGPKGTADRTELQDFNLTVSVNSSTNNPNNSGVGGNVTPSKFDVTVNLSGISQFGTDFSVAGLRQDGYQPGVMTGINIDKDGNVMATYSNGITRAEARLRLADVRNQQGLQAVGENKWIATLEAGNIIYSDAGDGTFGSLQSGALEESNVDLTAELVEMMTAQRAYQSNAQAIKTQDQVFSTLVNLR